MRIVVVGGGGREHAIAWGLARHGHALGFTHDNPGFEALGERLPADAVGAARAFRAELVVVGPEGPLAEGLVDALAAQGIPAFGPTRAAARLETSKVFTKRFCDRHGLPTAAYEVVEPGQVFAADRARCVKLDGLAAGKGAWVCGSSEETTGQVMAAQRARPRDAVLVEDLLAGPEVSVLAISDGVRIEPLPPARDHKRRFDGDRGPNTGGMGAVAPVAVDALDACHEVLQRTVAGMASEGTPFRGVLYGGFMLTDRGPVLLEFNTRFGDPECQVLQVLLDEDPAPWYLGAATGQLPPGPLRRRDAHACCVVVCGTGYPEVAADAAIESLPADADDLVVFHAGTARVDGRLRAKGGRVLGVTGLGPTPAAARERAYAAVREVRFEGAAWRSDIGATRL
jgi:phosphoribosylamine--glycine ligase